MEDVTAARRLMYGALVGGTLATYLANRHWRASGKEEHIVRLAAVMFVVMVIVLLLIITNIWAMDEYLVITVGLVEAYHVVVTFRLYQTIIRNPALARHIPGRGAGGVSSATQSAQQYQSGTPESGNAPTSEAASIITKDTQYKDIGGL